MNIICVSLIFRLVVLLGRCLIIIYLSLVENLMNNRFESLDGWRGLSILFVLAGHLLPLGLSAWKMNATVATSGMVLFFILSGFLITTLLIRDDNVVNFLIRRFMRIVPLAWLVLLICLFFNNATIHEWLSNLFFYANWPPMGLIASAGHFWSLCVEVQFYIFIAIAVFLLRDKAIWTLPVLCLLVTSYRMYNGVEIAINTYYRVDEILAGCILAIFYHKGSANIKYFFSRLNPAVLFVLLIASSHPDLGFFNYLRPYIALLLIGSTLFATENKWYKPLLENRFLFFMAGISYALYVIHGVLMDTWLAQGDNTLEKYAKRPLFFLVTFLLAYLSTRYYESYWIHLGKRITHKAD